MEIYKSYHNTGGSHQVEFALTAKGWFYRLRWFPDEWKPMPKLKGTKDGHGDMWTTHEGTCEGKPYSVLYRFSPVTKVEKWEGCTSYPPLPDDKPVPVPAYPDNKALPAPGGDKHEGGTVTLSDLLSHNSSEDLPKTDVSNVPESLPTS